MMHNIDSSATSLLHYYADAYDNYIDNGFHLYNYNSGNFCKDIGARQS
jgi:hypothetical protein